MPAASLEAVDRYMLSRFGELTIEALDSYDAFDFQGVVHRLSAFATVDLSAFYVDVSKDRLYTLAAASASRRSGQTAMYRIVDGLARLLAPILPVTAEQLWKALPGSREVSVHAADFPARADVQALVDPALGADWRRLLALRDLVNVEIEARRREKLFGTSLGASVTLGVAGDDLALAREYEASLPMLFIVSAVQVEELAASEAPRAKATRADGVKCDRCWRIVPSVSRDQRCEGLCDRCVDALAEPVGT